MNVIIFDSVSDRATKNAAIFHSLGSVAVFMNKDNSLVAYSDSSPVQSLICDLVLLHKSDEAAFNALGKRVKYSTVLLFSGGGGDGKNYIPWGITPDAPLAESIAREIVAVCLNFPADRRDPEFEKIWSGVPVLLVAWALSKHLAVETPRVSFEPAKVADAYNQLRKSLSLRPKIEGNLPPECGVGSLPSLEQAKLLIQLARVDM